MAFLDSVGVGYVCVTIAVIMFGTNFIPVKRYNMADGLFFQWVMCIGIWLTGLIVNIIVGSPQFEPIAMAGGALWCCGNIPVVSIIRTIGLGMGLLVWGGTQMIVGWSIGKFGLFGLNRNTIDHQNANYIGVGVALFAMFWYSMVKTNVQTGEDLVENPYFDYDSAHVVTVDANGEISPKYMKSKRKLSNHETSFTDTMSPLQRKVYGYCAAVVAGFLYAVHFTIPQYLIDHNIGSPRTIDYIFSHFSGALLTSTLFMVAYIFHMKNDPYINGNAIVASLISGIMWGLAQTAWFIANGVLQFVITFPIITTGPGIIGTLFGVFVFNEISGKQNYFFLALAFLSTFVAVGLIAFSSA